MLQLFSSLLMFWDHSHDLYSIFKIIFIIFAILWFQKIQIFSSYICMLAHALLHKFRVHFTALFHKRIKKWPTYHKFPNINPKTCNTKNPALNRPFKYPRHCIKCHCSWMLTFGDSDVNVTITYKYQKWLKQ